MNDHRETINHIEVTNNMKEASDQVKNVWHTPHGLDWALQQAPWKQTPLLYLYHQNLKHCLGTAGAETKKQNGILIAIWYFSKEMLSNKQTKMHRNSQNAIFPDIQNAQARL